jgi:hypothetical protein
MEDLDSQYEAIAAAAGVPLNVIQRLTPDEMRLLACIAEHRDRLVALPELAMHVFGKSGGVECRRIGTMLRTVRFAVCRYVTLAAAFGRYRGNVALAVRWEGKATDEDDASDEG